MAADDTNVVLGLGHLAQINGKREKLEGKLQQLYAHGNEQAKKEIDDFLGIPVAFMAQASKSSDARHCSSARSRAASPRPCRVA